MNTDQKTTDEHKSDKTPKERLEEALKEQRSDLCLLVKIRGYLFVRFKNSVGHVRRRVMFAHAAKTLRAQLSSEFAIAVKPANAIRKLPRIVRLHQQSAASLFQNFGEPAASWLHQRHSAGHRLQQRNAFRLIVRRRHRHHIEPAQERDLLRAI